MDIDVVFQDIAVDVYEPNRIALTVDGDLYSWDAKGLNVDIVEGPFVAIDAQYTLCAIHQWDGLKCWDYLGKEPYLVNPEVKGKTLCFGGAENCVLDYDGTVDCDGLSPDFDVPLTTLSCAYNKVLCGLTESGEGRCWNEEKGMWKLP